MSNPKLALFSFCSGVFLWELVTLRHQVLLSVIQCQHVRWCPLFCEFNKITAFNPLPMLKAHDLHWGNLKILLTERNSNSIISAIYYQLKNCNFMKLHETFWTFMKKIEIRKQGFVNLFKDSLISLSSFVLVKPHEFLVAIALLHLFNLKNLLKVLESWNTTLNSNLVTKLLRAVLKQSIWALQLIHNDMACSWCWLWAVIWQMGELQLYVWLSIP